MSKRNNTSKNKSKKGAPKEKLAVVDVRVKHTREVVRIEQTSKTEVPEHVRVWREQVLAGATYGNIAQIVTATQEHPLIVDIWREDVACGRTDLALTDWMKAAH